MHKLFLWCLKLFDRNALFALFDDHTTFAKPASESFASSGNWMTGRAALRLKMVHKKAKRKDWMDRTVFDLGPQLTRFGHLKSRGRDCDLSGSGEQINYFPKPKAEANNWSARHWQITIFCDNRDQCSIIRSPSLFLYFNHFLAAKVCDQPLFVVPIAH